jgi:hypothetical protein
MWNTGDPLGPLLMLPFPLQLMEIENYNNLIQAGVRLAQTFKNEGYSHLAKKRTTTS